MGQFFMGLLGLALLVAVGGALYIAMGDIPPPTETIEKTLPNERFAK